MDTTVDKHLIITQYKSTAPQTVSSKKTNKKNKHKLNQYLIKLFQLKLYIEEERIAFQQCHF